MKWKKTVITNDEGLKVDAQAPVIISASRSTDIPAFYADWFVHRWEKGYVRWKNPFNGVYSYVSFANTRAVVFWSKNPKPMLKHIDFLNKQIKNYYFQYTLNDYENEGFEGNVPKLEKRIKTFKELSRLIGKERVIWRFDPLMLTNDIDVGELLNRIKNIGDELKYYTEKMVFSFIDIKAYKKVANNLKQEKIDIREFSEDAMVKLAAGLQELNKSWKFNIATCAEKIDLEKFGIQHNKCIDDDLMIKLFKHDEKLMDFLGVKLESGSLFDEDKIINGKKKNLKDKGQRELCGCIISKDIGQYNTCPHECIYCYANTSKDVARINYKKSKKNSNKDTII